MAGLPTASIALRKTAGDKLSGPGAYYVIDSVADLLPVLDDIARKLKDGIKP